MLNPHGHFVFSDAVFGPTPPVAASPSGTSNAPSAAECRRVRAPSLTDLQTVADTIERRVRRYLARRSAASDGDGPTQTDTDHARLSQLADATPVADKSPSCPATNGRVSPGSAKKPLAARSAGGFDVHAGVVIPAHARGALNCAPLSCGARASRRRHGASPSAALPRSPTRCRGSTPRTPYRSHRRRPEAHLEERRANAHVHAPRLHGPPCRARAPTQDAPRLLLRRHRPKCRAPLGRPPEASARRRRSPSRARTSKEDAVEGPPPPRVLDRPTRLLLRRPLPARGCRAKAHGHPGALRRAPPLRPSRREPTPTRPPEPLAAAPSEGPTHQRSSATDRCNTQSDSPCLARATRAASAPGLPRCQTIASEEGASPCIRAAHDSPLRF